jgi:ABC-2 type transport system ATP-binding protein
MKIEVKNLTKRYGPQLAVDNINFTVDTGEIVGFLGPNGAGKTTTMKIITNFISPTAGEVLIDGKSIKEQPNEIKRHIGYLPENNPLYNDMPVIDYLRYVAELLDLDNVTGRIKDVVEKVGLYDEKHKKIGELSKGYKQRVGLAQAIIHNPEILILDEPTSGLDPNQIVEIRKLIRELGKEKTVILSTHILPEVEAITDRILIINKGKIVADGTSESLKKQASENEILIVEIEGATPPEILSKLNELPTVGKVDMISRDGSKFEVTSRPGLSSKKEIFTMCVNNNWFLTQLTPVERKLEDIFRQLTLN